MILKLDNREDWLHARKQGIGGSDAGSLLGLNKYCSNAELYKLKAGLQEAEDISDKPAVQYGKEAEQHIRELFKLDYPQYNVDYHEFWMYFHEKHSFMYATLDGELTDKTDGRRGILEIKTTTIQNSIQWQDWDDGNIPQKYFAQIIHQLACTGWDFAWLRAYIRYYGKEGKLKTIFRDYYFERADYLQDIEYLENKEFEFWKNVQQHKQPALLLPQI